MKRVPQRVALLLGVSIQTSVVGGTHKAGCFISSKRGSETKAATLARQSKGISIPRQSLCPLHILVVEISKKYQKHNLKDGRTQLYLLQFDRCSRNLVLDPATIMYNRRRGLSNFQNATVGKKNRYCRSIPRLGYSDIYTRDKLIFSIPVPCVLCFPDIAEGVLCASM